MINYGLASYFAGAGLSAILAILFLIGWKGKRQGILLLIASLLNALWCLVLAYEAWMNNIDYQYIFIIETIRNAAWLIFIVWLLNKTQDSAPLSKINNLVIAVLAVSLFYSTIRIIAGKYGIYINYDSKIFLTLSLGQALSGLFLVELLYRNISAARRWAIKFLCFGIGGIFAYDFFLYSHALLYNNLDASIWNARGLINAFVIPFIAVSAARNPDWSLDVFVSRKIVLHSVTLIAVGVYLLLMSIAGYLIRSYGSSWSGILQAVFLFGMLLTLLIVLTSGQIRAYLKVFINKHFFNYRYDYREEWLKLTNTLTGNEEDISLKVRAILAVSAIVESPGGSLWLRDNSNRFYLSRSQSMPFHQPDFFSHEKSLFSYLRSRDWIINIDEYKDNPDAYQNLTLPEWLIDSDCTWLLVPLILRNIPYGIIILARSRVDFNPNWENYDLLKIAGRQVASHLAEEESSMALIENRQFKAFHQLSTYLMHDLKNINSQLSLISQNADRHRQNPEFIDDVLETVKVSSDRIRKLTEQLRKGDFLEKNEIVSITNVIKDLVRELAVYRPIPGININNAVQVAGDYDRFLTVFRNLIRNAQQATPEGGEVVINLDAINGDAVVDIVDTGSGMDPDFIEKKLFKPFETTKGAQGMGIGVYEAREYIRSLGGRIVVESKPGSGTKFRCYLPLVTPSYA